MTIDIKVKADISRGDTPAAAPNTTVYVAFFIYKLNHRSTISNTGLGSTTSAPRGGDIGDNRTRGAGRQKEARAAGSRPSGQVCIFTSG